MKPATKTTKTTAAPKAKEKPSPPARRERRPKPKLPTVSRLASMAAVMASPTEEAWETARRAMELWSACKHQILVSDVMERYAKPVSDGGIGEEAAFLRKCGLNIITLHRAAREGRVVSFQKFLNACKPSQETKWEDIKAKWRDFRKGCIEIDMPHCLDESAVLSALDDQMKADREEGIPVVSLLGYWRRFVAFSERDTAAKRSAAGKMGGRPKKS